MKKFSLLQKSGLIIDSFNKMQDYFLKYSKKITEIIFNEIKESISV